MCMIFLSTYILNFQGLKLGCKEASQCDRVSRVQASESNKTVFLMAELTGEGNGNPPQYSCLENPMDRGAWQATVHGVARVGHDMVTKLPPTMEELGFWGSSVVKNLHANVGDARDANSILGQKDPLEKEMATHSSILAWRIPWTEESDGLQSLGCKRVRHNLRTNNSNK